MDRPSHLAALEIGTAAAEKSQAIALVQIEKQFRLDRLCEDGPSTLIRSNWWPHYAWGYYAGFWGGFYDPFYFGWPYQGDPAGYYDYGSQNSQAVQTRKESLADQTLADTTQREDLKLAFQTSEELKGVRNALSKTCR